MQTRAFCRVPRKAAKPQGVQGGQEECKLTQPMCLVARKTLVSDFLEERRIPPGVRFIVQDYAHPSVFHSSTQQFVLRAPGDSGDDLKIQFANSARLALHPNGSVFATVNARMFQMEGSASARLFQLEGSGSTELSQSVTAVRWDEKAGNLLCIGANGTAINRVNGPSVIVYAMQTPLSDREDLQIRDLVVDSAGSIYLGCSATKAAYGKARSHFIVKCLPTMELDPEFGCIDNCDDEDSNRCIGLALNERDDELFLLEERFASTKCSTTFRVCVFSRTTADIERVISLKTGDAKDRSVEDLEPRCIAYIADTLLVAWGDQITGYSTRYGAQERLFQTNQPFGNIRDICVRDNTLAVLDARPGDTKVKIHRLILG